MTVALLAKRIPGEGAVKTLADHSLDVFQAALALFGTAQEPTRLAEAWMRFFRLGDGDARARFHAHLVACAWLHDIGKANEGFQDAMQYGGDRQIVRHEHFSALLLAWPPMTAWLGAHPSLEPDLIISAVACHHLKADPNPPRFASYPSFGERYPHTERSRLRIAEPEYLAELLKTVAAQLRLPEPPQLPPIWSFEGGQGESIPAAVEALRRRFRLLGRRQRTRDGSLPDLTLPALKAALIVADAAGSGLPRINEEIGSWIAQAFPPSPLSAEDIRDKVLEPRTREITERRRASQPGYRFVFQDFQHQAAALPCRGLLLAGCGTGKTLAAWRWVAAQLDRRPARHALFLYPTRATATEGFKDYVSHAPEANDATLLSGTGAYELQGMFDNPDDPRSECSYEADARLFAVGFWPKRLFSATVDQFLGFMQQAYKSTCLLPVLADSVVVIDEVHSFDPALFAALTRFLATFDLPVLCMTASLPQRRRRQLEERGFAVHPRSTSEFADLEARASAPRYRILSLDDEAAAREIAIGAVRAGQRVLWVVNTVDRCQRLAQSLAELQPLCYHSRFRLMDRNARHREVIGRFGARRDEAGGLIAITTQVCEMSLDLDADVLITEQAPITALIQRMGRCHRHEWTGRPLGQVCVYMPEGHRPYERETLAAAGEFVAELAQRGTASQADLEELLERYSRLDPAEGDILTAFLDDGPWAKGGSRELRDGDDASVPAVLDADLERWSPGAEGLVVPVPRHGGLAEPDPRLPRHLRRAPASHYSPELGFLKHPLETTQDATQ
ncbi:CRISPR-associated helicase Cas3' [Thiococcus pfennigii]|uniref:CRISPR-associated helicase Cas3' n=1 Tax=Thiococcus pfennigii TaxID=1057 RepID=UPI0019049E6B|nr:CRISPR-associated helicase Cas3' [Thiococcus pfennigii]MBK1699592.1 hypothetical protein [Thiococcus pfennigii]